MSGRSVLPGGINKSFEYMETLLDVILLRTTYISRSCFDIQHLIGSLRVTISEHPPPGSCAPSNFSHSSPFTLASTAHESIFTNPHSNTIPFNCSGHPGTPGFEVGRAAPNELTMITAPYHSFVVVSLQM